MLERLRRPFQSVERDIERLLTSPYSEALAIEPGHSQKPEALLEHVGVPGGYELCKAKEKHLLDDLDPDRPATSELDLHVTVRIELESRAWSLEYRISARQRPEATVALEAERSEPLLDFCVVGITTSMSPVR